MPEKNTIKKTWDIDLPTYTMIEQIATERNCSVTAIANEALRYYNDRYYLEHKATMLPNDILEAMRSTVSLLEHRLDNGPTSCFPAWPSRCLSSINFLPIIWRFPLMGWSFTASRPWNF